MGTRPVAHPSMLRLVGRATAVGLAVALAIALAMGAAGCVQQPEPNDIGDLPVAPAPVEETTTTTTAPVERPATTVLGPGVAPDLLPPYRSDGASGDGCTPGGPLPDGWWFGEASSIDGGTLVFDLACFYVGDAAVVAARDAGDVAEGGYYVVDVNPNLRQLRYGPTARGLCLRGEQAASLELCQSAAVQGAHPVWVRIVDGYVDVVVEQYLP